MTTKQTGHTSIETKIYSVNGHPTIGIMIEGSWVALNELDIDRLHPIVTACNSHYELVEALKQITEDAEDNRMTQASINKAKNAISKAQGETR